MTVPLTTEQTLDALRAAGEPTRLRMLALLACEELAVFELAQVLDQSQPRVSRHLKVLTEAGLVERFADGAWAFYRLTAEPAPRELLASVLGATEAGALDSADASRLREVRRAREAEAAAYFSHAAGRWDEIRSLYVAEAAVEQALEQAAGPGRFARLVDLGTGTGRMLTLLGGRADAAVGIDLSQNMLNIARRNAAASGLERVELRHGDIFSTRLPTGCADLVIVHQVLHYLSEPAAALAEAARLLAPGGRLVVADFAPHALEFLREEHQHRRLGFSDEEMQRWFEAAGLQTERPVALPPAQASGLTVKIWAASAQAAPTKERKAA